MAETPSDPVKTLKNAQLVGKIIPDKVDYYFIINNLVKS